MPEITVATLVIGEIAPCPIGGQTRHPESPGPELARARAGQISESLGLRGGVPGTPVTQSREGG